MAAQTREQNTAVIEDLFRNPRNYAFAQAIRLLRLHAGPQTGVEEFLHGAISVVPELSLGHPGSDIVSVRELPPRAKDDPARYEIVATFLALYGSSSPLPTFYTEELLEEARSDASASRDFLNIFNNALYALYYQAFNRYKLGLRVMEQQDKSLLDLQYSLLGYGDEASRRASGFGFEDLRFINLFSPHSRSAQGLQLCLRLGLGVAHVEIEECVPCAVPVPERQLCRLGKPSSALGEAVLGRSVPDMEGLFRIHLHDLDAEGMTRFAPGGEGHARAAQLVHNYLNVPLHYDLVLHAAPDAAFSASPGTPARGRIGINAFLTRSDAGAADAVTHYGPRTAGAGCRL